METYIRNCEIVMREGDPAPFVFVNGKLVVRLDGYRIVPKEQAPAAAEAVPEAE